MVVRCCIVGGGISGLKAASDLAAAGVEVVVLEARDRLGGRILTNHTGQAPYDMGASWFHDTLANPLFTASREAGHQLHYGDDEPVVLTSSGPVPQNAKLRPVLEEMLKFTEHTFFESLEVEDTSVQNMAYRYIHHQRDLLTETQVRLVPQLARDLELWHGISWLAMSAKYALIDHQGRDSYMKSGYDTLIQAFEALLPENSIRLSLVVTKISRSHGGVWVTTNGTAALFDYVVVTVPQSVLALPASAVAGIEWQPPLPLVITEALDQMSFGSLGKVVMEFPEVFWPSEDRFLCLADPDESLVRQLLAGELVEVPVQTVAGLVARAGVPQPWDWPVNFFNLHLIYGVPTLMALVQSPLTNHLEQTPEDAWSVLEPMVAQIAKAAGKPCLAPTKVLVTDWSLSPFSRGSYSAAEPGNDPTDIIVQLSEGLNRVRFAGEHTIGEGAGCVHGAWASGQREAQYILSQEGLLESPL